MWKCKILYTSHQIQNEIFQGLAEMLQIEIIKEVKECEVFSVIANETKDLQKRNKCLWLYNIITMVSSTKASYISRQLKSMNWPSAQRFCRENFVDLASVRNETENQSILKSWSSGHFPWLGLYRDPNVYWSDGSSFLFSNWYNGKIPLGSMRIVCGVTSIQLSGSWKLLSCETRLPFVCYKLPGECFYRFFVKD
uniref:C-type lectin domain-containing protein n=1 Tax=Kryptolebias marmoratus TaxID=37003 RepID=A0A3Q3GHE8_KRYMA